VKISNSNRNANNVQVNLVFSISQHSDDKELLNHISEYLGCGKVELVRTRLNQSTYVQYAFNNHLDKIIPFFNEYSLLGIKKLDFQDFCKVAYLMKEKAHLREEGISYIRSIKSGMNSKRK
jgi:hypothetical protein